MSALAVDRVPRAPQSMQTNRCGSYRRLGAPPAATRPASGQDRERRVGGDDVLGLSEVSRVSSAAPRSARFGAGESRSPALRSPPAREDSSRRRAPAVPTFAACPPRVRGREWRRLPPLRCEAPTSPRSLTSTSMPSIWGISIRNAFSTASNCLGSSARNVLRKVASSSPIRPMCRASLTGLAARMRSRGSEVEEEPVLQFAPRCHEVRVVRRIVRHRKDTVVQVPVVVRRVSLPLRGAGAASHPASR